MKRRVVITGIGVVAPNAIGKMKYWEALANGKSGIKRITRFDVSSYPTQIAGEIQDFDPEDFMSPRSIKRSSRASQFAFAAAVMALDDARLDAELKSKLGIVIGVSSSAADIIESQHGAFMQKGLQRVNPWGVMSILPSLAANLISSEFGVQGTVLTIANGCAAGLDAIGYAYTNILNGMGDIFLAGGAESQLTPFGLAMLSAPRIMSTRNDEPQKASRPFDRMRDGGVLSEGAGMVVIEEMEHAIKRGAHIYAEVIGYANRCDGKEVQNGSGIDTGIYRAMKGAIENAGISADQIDYICAHAPSDQFDTIETNAIKSVLGRRAYSIPTSSIKSMIGNPLSAAGPLQLIASIMVFERNIIPPTINYEYPDPDCDLDYVPNKARECKDIRTILINSHGFGGINSSLIIVKPPSQ